jgi:hypothetical protein
MKNEKSHSNSTFYPDICQQKQRKTENNSHQDLLRVEICLQGSGIHNKGQVVQSLLVIKSHSS